MAENDSARRVFISHGHNEAVKLKLRTFIKDRLKLNPIVLTEQPDLGLTVIEKLEKYGKDSHFALIVLTADDETASGGARARQNVIHELGFFHGVLGRNKVLLLKENRVELFSNISGLIYKEFEANHIEGVFEDIRLALETGSAQGVGTSIPKEAADDLSKLVAQSLNVVAHDWPKIERDSLKKGIHAVIAGLPEDLHIARLELFLRERRIKYQESLAKATEEAEQSTAVFQATPSLHGGKLMAMSMAVYRTVAPQSAIGLIDTLVSEITILKSASMSPKDIVDRLDRTCDSHL